jgi:hypothetical protein
MHQADEAALANYPHGRGYGHDYMRGGEVLGGYGYAERDEYSKARGDLDGADELSGSTETPSEPSRHHHDDIRT